MQPSVFSARPPSAAIWIVAGPSSEQMTTETRVWAAAMPCAPGPAARPSAEMSTRRMRRTLAARSNRLALAGIGIVPEHGIFLASVAPFWRRADVALSLAVYIDFDQAPRDAPERPRARRRPRCCLVFPRFSTRRARGLPRHTHARPRHPGYVRRSVAPSHHDPSAAQTPGSGFPASCQDGRRSAPCHRAA